MSVPIAQRQELPAWKKTGPLLEASMFGGTLLRVDPHRFVTLRYYLREAAIGVPDSGYADPEGMLGLFVEQTWGADKAQGIKDQLHHLIVSARLP